MTIPRRPVPAPNGKESAGSASFILVPHTLVLSEARRENGQCFSSLAEILGKAELVGGDEQDETLRAVERHPLLACAVQEHSRLVSTFIPGLRKNGSKKGIKSEYFDEEDGPVEENPELNQALKLYIEVTRERKRKSPASGLRSICDAIFGKCVERRCDTKRNGAGRQNAEQFFELQRSFLAEYTAAVSELEGVAPAEPQLKGTHLSEKIQELKNTVKRKYGSMVQTLQKECVNKRRRANLSDHAVEILREWFRDHTANPYPTEDEKAELARQAQVSEAQVSNWFVNVRKRYWKPHAAGDSPKA